MSLRTLLNKLLIPSVPLINSKEGTENGLVNKDCSPSSLGSGVCQQRCRLNFTILYCKSLSILTHRVRALSTAIAHAIQAFLLRQFCRCLAWY